MRLQIILSGLSHFRCRSLVQHEMPWGVREQITVVHLHAGRRPMMGGLGANGLHLK